MIFRFGADDGARAIGTTDDDDVGFGGGGDGGIADASGVGHRQRSPNSAALTVVRSGFARAALRLGKISGIWQELVLFAALTRAREAGRARCRLDRLDRPGRLRRAARPARAALVTVAGGCCRRTIGDVAGSAHGWLFGYSGSGPIDDDARAIGDDRRWRRRRSSVSAATGSHRQRSPNSAALTWCALASLAQRCGSERSAEFGRN